MDRSATYDFLLVIYSNHGPISHRFGKNVIIAKFSHPVHLTPPLRGFPLEFCNGAGDQKN